MLSVDINVVTTPQHFKMKVLFALLVVVALVSGEPPRQGRFSGALRPPSARQVAPTYGPPPKPSYGPPPQETTPVVDITTEAEAEPVPTDQPERFSRPQKQTRLLNKGQYYLLVDGGRRLQRVVYITEEDLERMAVNARLTYRDVEPIRGPIYNADLINEPFIPLPSN